MALIPDDVIQEVIRKNDIVDVVEEYVSLDKKSASNYFGLCPFHRENTPSFSVSPSKQIFYCFGCGKGGHVIRFIQDIESLTFPEAVHFLADRVGMDIQVEDDPRAQQRRERRKRLAACMVEAARYFYMQFQSPSGAEARAYMLEKRSYHPSTLKKFGIGYAGEDWDGLLRHLKSKGYQEEEILACGLAKKSREGRVFDLFRGRVMIPVFDAFGTLVAFGGRNLGPELPKYINSPETELYRKSEVLFALNFAKRSHDKRIVLTEGYMDTISLHAAGCETAVASLGTALTPQHLRLLTQYASDVVVAYDSDEAGQKAAERAIEMMKNAGVAATVLLIPGSKDPDDYVKEFGAERFLGLLDKGMYYLDFKLHRARLASMNSNGALDPILYQDKAAELLAKEENRIEQELYANKVAGELSVSPATMMREVERRRKNEVTRTSREESNTIRKKVQKILSKEEMIVLAALLNDNTLLGNPDFPVEVEDFPSQIKNLIQVIFVRLKEGRLSIVEFLHLAERYAPEWELEREFLPFQSSLQNEELRPPIEYGKEALEKLRWLRYKRKSDDLALAFQLAESEAERKKIADALKENNEALLALRNEVENGKER